MKIFSIHQNIISDYSDYINSFIHIHDQRILEKVKNQLSSGTLWPEPLIHFNPAYELGDKISDLVQQGTVHEGLNEIFKGYSLYRHQSEALKLGAQGKGFVVTSGTGSGKSLTYLSTIFNHILANGSNATGVQAVIVYPMNALINSQEKEINKFRDDYEKVHGKGTFPVRYAKYTGQEKQPERDAVLSNPPHILLTNYMMLELVLTRTREEVLRNNIFNNLKYLVFDELHTYRGRQGSDVAMLIRRIKAQCKNELTYIGTSATMASAEDPFEQRQIVAKVASRFFPTIFAPEQVINEKLSTVTEKYQDPDPEELKVALKQGVKDHGDETYLRFHPLSAWLEKNVILTEKKGILFRAHPQKISSLLKSLSSFTGLSNDLCKENLFRFLQCSESVNKQLAETASRKSYFAYKIHQFINQTGSVYVTLERRETRRIELEAKTRTLPSEGSLPFFQVVFSRITGYDLLCVIKSNTEALFKPRLFRSFSGEEDMVEDGYLILQPDTEEDLWDLDRDIENLPESWIRYDKNGVPHIKKEHSYKVPMEVHVNNQGLFSETPKPGYIRAWYLSADSSLDITSGTLYDTKTNEGTMYATLGNEGRSTATNIIAFSVIKRFAETGYDRKEQKLLSFTDNRQDTALQSGHFNDFMKVGQLRASIYNALAKHKTLDYKTVNEAVYNELNIVQKEYVQKPAEPNTYQFEENEKALRSALMYKILYDLRRGWRVILPNLEQCALLRIGYIGLDEEVRKDKWKSFPVLGGMPIEERYDFIYQLLDYFRKANANRFHILSPTEIDNNYRTFRENLKKSWLYSPDEKIQYPNYLRVSATSAKKRNIYTASFGSRSAPGRFIKDTCDRHDTSLKGQAYEDFTHQLLDELAKSGFLVREDNILDVPLYQLNGTYIQWQLGDEKTIELDKVKNPSYKQNKPRINEYFQSFYKTRFREMKPIVGGEHSGQLKTDQRVYFEDRFRDGDVSMLCCSPTMELGIDISDLTVVHMRNVPPDPANYAQRSGRAGRSGQGALVFTYCSGFSAHDQHYFNNREDMVAGIVRAPKFDFSNPDLIRSHLFSLFLCETGIADLNNSLADLVNELSGNDFLELKSEIREKLGLSEERKRKLKILFMEVVKDIRDDERNRDWLNEEWVSRMLNQADAIFNKAFDRWRTLYKLAQQRVFKATAIENDVTIPARHEDKLRAKREKGSAQREIDLLRNQQALGSMRTEQSEFYPYRYLAAEGFLPGYNFTRLPVRVYVPHEEGQYLSRPRFLALNEFGPHNRIYYMGTKYQLSRMPVPDLANSMTRAKVSLEAGYFLVGEDDYNRNICPFTGNELNSDTTRELLHDLVDLTESRAEEQGRITCEEEERIRRGYDIRTYFSMKGNLDKIEKIIAKIDGEPLLEISYLPAAALYKVNRKWRSTNRDKFLLGENSGLWKDPSDLQNRTPTSEPIQQVQIYTSTTADALFIKPLKNLNLPNHRDGAITLLYALKRAIEMVFQAEGNEIGAEVMGKTDEPNIMLYEASEGSLGILRLLVRELGQFKRVAETAYDLCHFNKSEEDQSRFGIASYHDLLSYYNQYYHDNVNRLLIKDALENLIRADYEVVTNRFYKDYDEHYQRLKVQIDPTSSTEHKFIEFLYSNNIRLPDRAQVDLRSHGCPTIPDFLYHSDVKVCVFCDGIHHDAESVKKLDEQKRKCLENLGFEVLVWHYQTPLNDFIELRKDIFKTVR